MYELLKARVDIRHASDKLKMKIGQRDLLVKQQKSAEARKEKAEEQLGEFDLVQILLQKTSDYARQQAKRRIEEIVTSALTVVFDKDYRFEIEIAVKGNQPVAEYWLQSEDV